jgi:4-amino-4-deoxy-L-arabinose transferase-like glycosyltransferase
VLRAALLLLLLALVAHWPALSMPEWRGTEGRRVQIALQMSHSGDFMVPVLGDEQSFAKPPLYYWVLAEIDRLTHCGASFFAMRLPSVLAMWALAVLAFGLHRRAFGNGAAWMAGLGIVLAPVLLADGCVAEIDPLFTAFTAGSLCALACGVAQERRALVVLAGVLGGLALMTKGPPYFLFALGALLVWWRHRRLRWFWLWAVPLFAVPLCYYLPLLLLRVSPSDIAAVAGEESVGRMKYFTWRHVQETPEYLLRAVLIALPFGVWGLWEFRSTRNARMGPEDLTLRMCSAAAVVSVLVLTLFPARPTRYLLPMVPLVVFAVAPATAHYARQLRPLGKIGGGFVRITGWFGVVSLLAAPFLPMPLPGRTVGLFAAFALLPLLARTPGQLVASCLWMPLVAAWTLLPDRVWLHEYGGTIRTQVGPMLRRELQDFGADGPELRTFGHFNSDLLLGTGLLPPGNENAARLPDSRFILHEERNSAPLPALPDYRPLLRFCLPSGSEWQPFDYYVLEERKEAGR